MLTLSLAFLAGHIWLHSLPVINLAHCIAPFTLAALLALIPPVRRRNELWVIVAFLCGFVWAAVHARDQLRQDLGSNLEGQDVRLSGYIAEIPESETYGQRFVLRVEHSDITLPEYLELAWYASEPQLHAAQRWQLQVRLKQRHGFANPGGYDYEGQLFRRGIGATGYVRESSYNQSSGLAFAPLLRARAWLTERIARVLPDAPMQGVVRGLAVGDQQAIDSDAWQVFARTGTSHLMAISGFHIGMVALLFAWLGGRLTCLPMAQHWRITAPDLSAVFGLSAGLAYSLLAGMSVPTQRTLIMLAVYFGARLLRREVNVWHNFGVALTLVLLVDPFAPLAPGAWLSFGAVAVILLNRQGRLGRIAAWRNLLGVQGIVTLGLTPLLLCCFGSLSLVSPFVNLLAIPLFTGVLVPLVLLACGLLVIAPALGEPLLQGISILLDWSYAGLAWAAGLPWATWYAPAAPWWATGLLVIGVTMMVLPWLWLLRLGGVVASLPALLYRPDTPPPGAFELSALDVGQGLAVVVRTAYHTLVYDTGPAFQSGRDTGELVLLPYLRALGVSQVDVLMLSHGDSDHVGGARTVLSGTPVNRLLAGPSVTGLSAQQCRAGQHWQWDGVSFEVLHPTAATFEDDNNSSCVLRINGVGGNALLTGDIEQEAERGLVDSGVDLSARIVLAPHHGSRSSSTPEFVAATKPDDRQVGAFSTSQWVVFSTGYLNRWGFPKQEVAERWRAAGATLANTAQDGALSFHVGAQGVAVQRYRQSQQRYWRY